MMSATEEQRQRTNAYNREWRAKNREKSQAIFRKSYEKNKTKKAERSAAYYRAHPEKYKELRRAAYQNNREIYIDKGKKWATQNPEKMKTSQRWSRIKRVYGLTRMDWEALFAAQDSKCANPGCRSETSGSILNWHVDHDHNLKKGDPGFIRGILCAQCNVLLAHARDNIDVLSGAIDYLRARPHA